MRAWMAATVLMVGLAGCSSTAPAKTEDHWQHYSCCTSADVDRAYAPGDTLLVHWTVAAQPSWVTTAPVAETLTASITGPYATVDDLKAGATATSTYTAPDLHPAGADGEQPVSEIAIPAAAAPGYYNLRTGVGTAGQSAGGDAVIQVVAA